MRPEKSYTIWFTQRTGSTLLCKALHSTGIAGNPHECLGMNYLERYEKSDKPWELIWKEGLGDNGVFGVKHSHYQPQWQKVMSILKRFPGAENCKTGMDLYANAFPNGKHIFMSRRNKVRLAVSWWKAIQTGEFALVKGRAAKDIDVSDKYIYDAISSLISNCIMREAAIQELFDQAGIIPLNIYYEDFIADYYGTVYKILDYLELDHSGITITEPFFARQADEVSEEWVQRYRKECQEGWPFIGW